MAQNLAWDIHTDWAYALGGPLGRAVIKQHIDDFIVEEILKHEASGSGEHLWLKVQKTGANTEWVARQLAKWARVSARAVSYAGLKDRHGLTRQTFSIHLPGKADPDVSQLQDYTQGSFSILQQCRSVRKLQRGALAGNRFQIRLRDCVITETALSQRLQSIQETGVPNYFGEQRFGYDNLQQAVQQLVVKEELPRQRHLKSIYISTLRSYLFNLVLSQRVASGDWNRLLAGDWVMLEGSHSGFLATESDFADLQARCSVKDLHPTGPMPGEGDVQVAGLVADLEQAWLEPYQVWQKTLCRLGVDGQRRSLRLVVNDLSLSMCDGDPVLSFSLPAGAYATVVLREICQVEDAARQA